MKKKTKKSLVKSVRMIKPPYKYTTVTSTVQAIGHSPVTVELKCVNGFPYEGRIVEPKHIAELD